MLVRASASTEDDREAVLFYLYCENLAAPRDHLLANGFAVGEIAGPGPAREMGLADPDGCLMVAEIE